MAKDLVAIRVKFLMDMDYYVRNIIGDDVICYDIWCATGLPDGYDMTDLREIAMDDELWLDCVNTFARCVEKNEKTLDKKSRV